MGFRLLHVIETLLRNAPPLHALFYSLPPDLIVKPL